MVETIRVRRAGFACRTVFAEFLDRYAVIHPDLNLADAAGACRVILERAKIREKNAWAVGNSKLFYRSNVEQILEVRNRLND